MPLGLFFSYSHKDEALRTQLETHLATLRRLDLILPWHDRCIGAGDEWSNQIDDHLRSAQIILLLISPDFLASSYCFDVELKLALERHAAQQAIVIPVILRPCDWTGTPFSHLQALPRNGKAITMWPNQDEAFAEVAKAIREALSAHKPQSRPLMDTTPTEPTPEPRVLEAALPNSIAKDRATELLVLIRLQNSAGLQGFLQEDDEAEARPEDVRAKPFDLVFPLGPTGAPEPLKVAIEITAPDFDPPRQRKNIIVPVANDSEICSFLLTPVRYGMLTVVIELVWEDATRGSRRLRTTCASEAAWFPARTVARMPVTTSRALSQAKDLAMEATAGGEDFTRYFNVPKPPKPLSEAALQPGEFTKYFGPLIPAAPAPTPSKPVEPISDDSTAEFHLPAQPRPSAPPLSLPANESPLPPIARPYPGKLILLFVILAILAVLIVVTMATTKT